MRLSRVYIIALIASSAIIPGCGKVKERDDREVVMRSANTPSTDEVGGTHMTEDTIKKIAQFYTLYSDDSGISRQGMTNIFSRHKDKITSLLAGKGITTTELVDMMFSLDPNHDNKLSVAEIKSSASDHIPTLGWLGAEEKIAPADLASHIEKQFPTASLGAREGLQHVLASFDQPFAGGNGDGLLTQKELSMAGLIIGSMMDTDFLTGLPTPTNADEEQKLTLEQLNHKFTQQLYSRYKEVNWKNFLSADLTLEWIQFAIKFYLADKLVQVYGTAGKVAFADVRDVISHVGIPLIDKFDKLKQFYDADFMGGDGDGKLNVLELFNLVTDLEFSMKVRRTMDVKTTNLAANKPYFFNTLLAVFPNCGYNLFLTGSLDNTLQGKTVREAYWNSLDKFDTIKRGGNANSSLDPGELAMALGWARLLDNIFAFYDINHDRVLSRAEVKPLFERMNIHDPEAIRIFYADIGLEGNTGKFMMGMKLFFSGKKNLEYLTPYEFYVRMEEALPRVFAKKDQKSLE